VGQVRPAEQEAQPVRQGSRGKILSPIMRNLNKAAESYKQILASTSLVN
jgi:hypothetical protein